MKYEHIVTGTFLKRPNRFIARVLLEGQEVDCHVKNTGRLGELLLPGAKLLLEHHPQAAAAGRKTSYSLIGVWKENAGFGHQRLLVNIDSQAPNPAAARWLLEGRLSPDIQDVRREVFFGSSRFDLAFTEKGRPAFMEVKGVTLETNGLASFPDAPTERGVRHVQELIRAAGEGYGAYILFVIQMKGICAFTPNRKTHAAFADVLREADAKGVRILARDCLVTENTMTIDREIPVFL